MRRLLGGALVGLLLVPAVVTVPTAVAGTPPLWTPTATTPHGSHVVPCAWLPGSASRTLHIALPDRFGPVSNTEVGCASNGRDYDEWVYMEPEVGASLRTYREREVDPWVGVGGDEEVSDVVYAAGVPVLGGRTGESLSYTFAGDGVPLDVHYVQAQGVRLHWTVTAGEWAGVAAEFDAATASVGVDATREGTCTSDAGDTPRVVVFDVGRSVRSIDAFTRSCYLVLGSGTVETRTIRLSVSPTVGLSATRRALAARPDVRHLRRTGAHRLDYVRVLSIGPPRRVRVVQEDGVRATLLTSARHWRADLREYAAVRASIRGVAG